MLPNGHSGSAPDRQDAHLTMFGLDIAMLHSCMPTMEAMPEDCVVPAHLQIHAFIIVPSVALHPWPVTQHPSQHGTASFAFQLRLRVPCSPAAAWCYNSICIQTSSDSNDQPQVSNAGSGRYIAPSAVTLGVLQALVVLTCTSTEGQPRMQLLTRKKRK